MTDKFKYFIIVSQDSEEVERSEGTIAYFANPVGKGDTVYWDHENGSCGGVIKCVIHRHPFNYTGCLWTEKSNKDYSG
ncbi:hypothetical protein VCRA2119O147_1590010 [Vibrio crassostreae]|uniref:Uncharacterized protein n=1 Tax=Vibrio crassostreae TaxID=246167 RepID=A0A822N4X8_9VIBR|nr:hypothetical protein [Vibrio crassostreae]TCL15423.1 hypothetical protein EDB52_1366 [Vibrio crassostreae]TCN02710.1 hypothetical protein EDB35_1379 [Vibrio crassostreae]TCT42954.1 hypothetical protein EDB39_1309 [Vibrio crassostreae]TCT45684.1 hypothetical protein EDB42_1279 [Vibrio crassostreae]TCT48220.1 hypothetical protein EDB40_13021 [Vibrio crassostreae]